MRNICIDLEDWRFQSRSNFWEPRVVRDEQRVGKSSYGRVARDQESLGVTLTKI